MYLRWRASSVCRSRAIKAWLILTVVLSSVVVFILPADSGLEQHKRISQQSLFTEYLTHTRKYAISAYPDDKIANVTQMARQTPSNKIMMYIRPPKIVGEFSQTCLEILSGNKTVARVAKSISRSEMVSPYDFIILTTGCDQFRNKQKYTMTSTAEELDFPIAYSIVMYKDVAQAEHLLRAIYRPHNFYCIHIDAKANTQIHRAMASIANCLHNVFVISWPVVVKWGKFSVLEADLMCMKNLLKYKQWRYFINLTGQEYPLKTNLEIVRILKIFKGANNVDASPNYRRWFVRRWSRAWPPPHGIRPYKGNVHVFVNREFVQYAIHNQIAKDFILWLNFTGIPDETFFSTLNHNPHLNIPGSYNGLADTDVDRKPYIARFKNWSPFKLPCYGKGVHYICIFGVSDLPLLISRPELFANKFHWNFQPLALDCLEMWHMNKITEDNSGTSTFNDTYYRSIPYINNDMIV